MSKLHKMIQQVQQLRKQERGTALLRRLLQGGIRVMNARWQLRNARKGGLVSLRGKLHLSLKGTLELGERVSIWSHIGRTQISVSNNAFISIGSYSFVNTGSILSARYSISIGNNCQIANQVIIMDSDFHGVEDRVQQEKPSPIVIEDDAWIATRATILKGVRIGKGAVVAAGAVVTKDVPAYSMVAGVPAKVVKTLKPENYELA